MEGCIGYFTEEFEEILKEENKINEIIDLIIETYIKDPAEVIKSILSQV
jgi:hypothetical protein